MDLYRGGDGGEVKWMIQEGFSVEAHLERFMFSVGTNGNQKVRTN